MYKIIFLLLTINVFSQEIVDITKTKPQNQARFDEKTGNYIITQDLAKYYVTLEEQYKKILDLVILYEKQINNYKLLVEEKNREILLLNEKINLMEKDYSNKLAFLNKEITLYKNSFSITIGISISSLLVVGAFLGGYYVANIGK